MNEKKKPNNYILSNKPTVKEMFDDLSIRLGMIEEHLADKKPRVSIDPGIASIIAAIILVNRCVHIMVFAFLIYTIGPAVSITNKKKTQNFYPTAPLLHYRYLTHTLNQIHTTHKLTISLYCTHYTLYTL